MDKPTDKSVTENGMLAVSFTESPKKCNLSFSINFDFDDINNENSTDSENVDLQIDISELENYEPSSKHKREAIEEASMLNEMEEEIERQLDAEAAKTNLTASSVKNILKHVIPYEHLMTMIQKWLQDAQNDVDFGPKLTRAKAKKLAAAQVNIPWPITTTSQKASSIVQALIQEELPEDSSDEEYNPEHDKHSDDDREDREGTTSNDIESQLTMLMNDKDADCSKQQTLSETRYDPEGIFKIPAVPHVSIEEESIGQRTRSKLSLSETSLQEIEQAFIPPDITADMTEDWDCELDEDWDNFLKEFMQPLTQDPAIEDDPEADPEYNILEDEETDLLDKEELRTDKAVEVPRKEQYDLIAELLELTPMYSTEEEEEISRKKRQYDDMVPPIENNTMNCSMVDLLPVLAEPELPILINPEQYLLLTIQFQQHVQLMVQHFVMTYMHPEYHSLAKTCKENLNSLRYLSNGSNSAFNAKNLEEALKLVSTWENKFSDGKFCQDFQKTIEEETAKVKMNKCRHTKEFFPELQELFIESKALMYPQLLPQMPFRSGLKKHVKSSYLHSEENLIALGIEQFLPFVASKSTKFKTKRMQLIDAAQLISHYLLPCRDPLGISNHVRKCRLAKNENPIKHYFEKGCTPKIIHCITLENKLKAPKDQPFELLPLTWQTYLNTYNQKKGKNKLAKGIYLFPHIQDDLGKQKIYMNTTRKLYPNVPRNHPLRNPIVNILPKILPATLKPKVSTSEKIGSTKGTLKFSGNNSKKSLDNNAQMTEEHTERNETLKKVSNSPKTSTVDIKTTQTDKAASETLKSNVKLNTVLATNSMVSKSSSQKSTGLPQIRRTTPRLAKTRSAQNMKLMALGSKNSSNCNTVKKEKNTDKTIGEHDSASKVDNEDEIAELMLASTTIIKDSVSRKKAKQTRELEIIKRLLKAENPFTEEEREAKFAASYLQKLHITLEPNNPEIFKAVIKLFLDYNEKLESTNQAIGVASFSDEFLMGKETVEKDNAVKKDLLTVRLYEDVCKKLQNYPEMCTDLLLFLKPHQAAMINKSVEYIMLQKINNFVHVTQIYFAKQPSRIAKMMQAITQLSSDPHTTLENVCAVMNPVFKGHSLIMDLFLQILPVMKPPESLFVSYMFENLTCPLGPYDKNITHTENAAELYENIELPITTYQEDPYGGDNCKCDCHNIDDPNLKNNSDHCVSCGTRFLNGRIYLQTPEGLRPAKITFPGEEQEKLENIARVSLKIADKVVSTPISPKKRRKSSKNESNHEDICQKQCITKYSPIKDNEDNEKSKSKGGIKFTLKADKKKALKRVDTINQAIESKKMRLSQCKNKREKKTEENDALTEDRESAIVKQEKLNECAETENDNSVQLPTQENSSSTEPIVEEIPNTSNIDSSSRTMATDTITVIENNVQSESVNITCDTPWTRQEDMLLLQHIKKDYSENSFQVISEKLENRNVDQVKERCQILLSLLQKMM